VRNASIGYANRSKNGKNVFLQVNFAGKQVNYQTNGDMTSANEDAQ
jgi:hypothetical protein